MNAEDIWYPSFDAGDAADPQAAHSTHGKYPSSPIHVCPHSAYGNTFRTSSMCPPRIVVLYIRASAPTTGRISQHHPFRYPSTYRTCGRRGRDPEDGYIDDSMAVPGARRGLSPTGCQQTTLFRAALSQRDISDGPRWYTADFTLFTPPGPQAPFRGPRITARHLTYVTRPDPSYFHLSTGLPHTPPSAARGSVPA